MRTGAELNGEDFTEMIPLRNIKLQTTEVSTRNLLTIGPLLHPVR